eukprot:TRINITY_DN4546_c0_g1_i2.p1 TRINITY_DN4546_c0_g1~~TRINITY_DN4546_c0_g1_i2.p1  ORF type:complete len:531 (-),score=155.25 TRINITY_DN4546_c0_g1_i2:5-1597(-)
MKQRVDMKCDHLSEEVKMAFQVINARLSAKEAALADLSKTTARKRLDNLALQRVGLQSLKDLDFSRNFVEKVFVELNDTQMLTLKDFIVDKLRTISRGKWDVQSTPCEDDSWAIEVLDQPIFDEVARLGGVEDESVYPPKCEAEGEGLVTPAKGKPAQFTVIARTRGGKQKSRGGDSIDVKVGGSRENPRVEIKDNQDGTYLVTYYPQVGGDYDISVCFFGHHIEGSPFSLKTSIARDYVGVPLKMKLTFGSKGTEDGQFASPHSVAVNSKGEFIVTDSGGSCYHVFSAAGKFIRRAGKNGHNTGNFKEPKGISVNQKDEFAIIDGGMPTYRFQIFSPDGSSVVKEVGMMAGLKGGPQWKMRGPSGIAFTRKEQNVVVADTKHHRVEIFARDGSFLKEFGAQGSQPGQFDRPQAVAVNSQDQILVADTENHRIQLYRPDGSFLLTFGSIGSGEGQFNRPAGIAVDDDDNIIVADTENHRVQIFRQDGTFLVKFGSQGSGEGQFQFPFGIAVTADKSIAVCDMKNYRVQLW